MKIIAISDTHEQEKNIVLPEGDMLIHAGDWTYKGSAYAVDNFFSWFSSQPHKFKVCIAGNHELSLDPNHYNRNNILKIIKKYTDADPNLHYLEDSGVNIEGINIYGSPASPWFHSWAWNYHRGEAIAEVWKKIPSSTNLLITHGPIMNVLDGAPRGIDSVEHVGCKDLADRIVELPELKVHVFGHIHAGYGIQQIANVKFVNASCCTEKYEPINPPLVIEV